MDELREKRGLFIMEMADQCYGTETSTQRE